MNEKEFKELVGSGRSGGFLFFGEEPYLKRNAIAKLREQIVDEAFSVFNHIRIVGSSYSAESLRDAIAAPPMMSEKKLIELDELGVSDMKKSELDELCRVLEMLPRYDYSLLVLNAEDDFDAGALPKKPSAVYKQLCEVLVPVNFERATEAQLKGWVTRHFKAAGVVIGALECSEFVSFCGKGMDGLLCEIEKLSAYVLSHGGNTVTSEAIRQVCSRSEESDAFALVNAVLSGKSDAAFEALGDMKRRRIEPIAMLGSISRVYADLISVRVLLDKGLTSYDIASRMKMHEYKAKLYCNSARSAKTEKLKRAIALCLEADLELKSGTAGYLPIEKVVCALSSKDVI